MFSIDRNGIVSYANGNAVVEPVVAPTATTETALKPKVEPIDNAYMYVDDAINESFYFVDKQRLSNPDSPVRVLMVGPSGYGKSSIPQAYANKVNLDFFRMDCATVRDPEEWFGQRTAKEGSTHFVLSTLARHLINGNCVIMLDEINRVETYLTNSLYAILDNAKGTTIYDGVEIKLGKNIVIVGTLNLGHNYSGTFSMDAALSNRFEYICEVGNIPVDHEIKVLVNRVGIEDDKAKSIVNVATNVRALNAVECSIRTTLMIATMVKNGMSVRNAYQTAVVLRCNTQSVRKQVIDLVNKIGIYTPSKKFF